jgi:hypothetical protein
MTRRVTPWLAIGALQLLAVLAPLRWDATHDRRFTTSTATHEALAALGDTLTITVVCSADLPAAYRAVLRDARDLATDLQAESRRRIRVRTLDPNEGPELAEWARGVEVGPLRVAGARADGFDAAPAYAALVVTRGDDEVVARVDPLLPGVSTEYELARQLLRVAPDREVPHIGFSVADGSVLDALAAPLEGDATPILDAIAAQVLDNRYRLSAVDRAGPLPDDLDALILLGPTEDLGPSALAALRRAHTDGLAIALLLDPWRVIELGVTPRVEPNQLSVDAFLRDWGVERRHDRVLDEVTNQLSLRWQLVAGADGVPIELPVLAYDARLPLMTELNTSSSLVAGIPVLAFQPTDRRRPAPIGTLAPSDGVNEATRQTIARTAPTAARYAVPDPAAGAEPIEQGAFETIVAVVPLAGDSGVAPGRLVVTSSSSLVANVFVQDDPLRDPRLVAGADPDAARVTHATVAQYNDAAMQWFANLVDWLVADERLIALRARTNEPRVTASRLERSDRIAFLVRAVGTVPACVLGIGLVVAFARRRRSAGLGARFTRPVHHE